MTIEITIRIGLLENDIASIFLIGENATNGTPGFETLSKMSDIFQKRIEYIMGKPDDASVPVMDEAIMEDLALSQVEDDLTEYALKYARLDQY